MAARLAPNHLVCFKEHLTSQAVSQGSMEKRSLGSRSTPVKTVRGTSRPKLVSFIHYLHKGT
jgi:hypothetical protein